MKAEAIGSANLICQNEKEKETDQRPIDTIFFIQLSLIFI